MQVTPSGTSCLLKKDDQALVMALERPHRVTTFGEYADVFVQSVFIWVQCFDRIDRCQHSITTGTRMKQTHGIRPIRRIIENESVPLSKKGPTFCHLVKIKQIFFLSGL